MVLEGAAGDSLPGESNVMNPQRYQEIVRITRDEFVPIFDRVERVKEAVETGPTLAQRMELLETCLTSADPGKDRTIRKGDRVVGCAPGSTRSPWSASMPSRRGRGGCLPRPAQNRPLRQE
jgi:hypothetical protein